MSIQSDAAKAHIEALLHDEYVFIEDIFLYELPWKKEYRFDPDRRWRFDYAVPTIKCAIEVQGGNFVKGAHSNPAALRKSYERSNRATELGWRVWYFMPEQVVKCKVGRKTMPDEIIPVLKKLPWL